MNPIRSLSTKMHWLIISLSIILSLTPGYSAFAGNQNVKKSAVQNLTPIKYDGANNFVGGFAPVELGTKWGGAPAAAKVTGSR